MDYLGHVIRPGNLEISNHVADAIRKLRIPTTVRGSDRSPNVVVSLADHCLTLQGSCHHFQNGCINHKPTGVDPLPEKS